MREKDEKPINESDTEAKTLFHLAADRLRSSKDDLLAKWREVVRADSRLPDGRFFLTDEEMEDDLPALLDSIEKGLRNEEIPEESIRNPGAQHGSTRRAHGYSVAQLVPAKIEDLQRLIDLTE